MINQWYIIMDSDNREVNFYDTRFPNSKFRAIQSAKQVEASCVVLRRKDTVSGEVREETIWSEE